ncbi:hypothetical protein pipiens_007993 [Culex pipiens pipiens]|uniref:Transposable element P transposase-like RNase H domain-containing protein n=1 Tax=Culex pipiens pipiens TaxID=38569 RepID=A0ABD1DJ24_CULPP
MGLKAEPDERRRFLGDYWTDPHRTAFGISFEKLNACYNVSYGTDCSKWVTFCKNKELEEAFQGGGVAAVRCRKVCADHFRETDFVNPRNKSQGIRAFALPAEHHTAGIVHEAETDDVILRCKLPPGQREAQEVSFTLPADEFETCFVETLSIEGGRSPASVGAYQSIETVWNGHELGIDDAVLRDPLPPDKKENEHTLPADEFEACFVETLSIEGGRSPASVGAYQSIETVWNGHELGIDDAVLRDPLPPDKKENEHTLPADEFEACFVETLSIEGGRSPASVGAYQSIETVWNGHELGIDDAVLRDPLPPDRMENEHTFSSNEIETCIYKELSIEGGRSPVSVGDYEAMDTVQNSHELEIDDAVLRDPLPPDEKKNEHTFPADEFENFFVEALSIEGGRSPASVGAYQAIETVWNGLELGIDDAVLRDPLPPDEKKNEHTFPADEFENFFVEALSIEGGRSPASVGAYQAIETVWNGHELGIDDAVLRDPLPPDGKKNEHTLPADEFEACFVETLSIEGGRSPASVGDCQAVETALKPQARKRTRLEIQNQSFKVLPTESGLDHATNDQGHQVHKRARQDGLLFYNVQKELPDDSGLGFASVYDVQADETLWGNISTCSEVKLNNKVVGQELLTAVDNDLTQENEFLKMRLEQSFPSDGKQRKFEKNKPLKLATEAVAVVVSSLSSLDSSRWEHEETSKRFKVPIGYLLAHHTMGSQAQMSMLEDVVEQLESRGLFPLVVTVDQCQTNMKMAREAGVTKTNPVIRAENESKKLTIKQRKPNYIQGFINNILAIRWLWTRLATELEFEHFCTNYVSSDTVENFNSDLRRKCGRNDAPNAYQYASAFKYSAISATEKLAEGSNCEQDNAQPLLGDADIVSNVKHTEPLINYEYDFEPLDESYERGYTLKELNGLMYIVGYAALKIPHKRCRKYLCIQNDPEAHNELLHKFCKLKQASIYPSTKLYEIGLQAFNAYKQKFNRFLYQNRRNVKARLKEYLSFEKYEKYTCEACFGMIIDKIFNILIKSFLKEIRIALKKKNAAKRDTTAAKRNRKAIKMDLP